MYDIRRKQNFGATSGGIELTSDATKYMNKVCMEETQCGGRFWKMINVNNVLPGSPMLKSSTGGPLAFASTIQSPRSSPKSRSQSPPKFKIPKSFPGGAGDRSPKGFPPLGLGGCSPSSSQTGGFWGEKSCVGNSPMQTKSCGFDSMGSSPMATDGFQSQMNSPSSSGGFPGRAPSMAATTGGFMPRILSEGAFAAPLKLIEEPIRATNRCRLDCLAPSASLPSLPPNADPKFAARMRKHLARKNNSEIRKESKMHIRDARSIYGGAMVKALPKLDPKEPFKPAKASMILPDYRRGKNCAVSNFEPRNSEYHHFFSSAKSKSLFDHYHKTM